MDGIKIMVLAIVGTLLALVLKEQKTYFGISLGLLCALCVFFMGLPYLEKTITYARTLYSTLDNADGYISILLKITGIATVATLTSNLCSDSGMSSIASVVNFCGKVICMCLTLPVIGNFFEELMSVLP